MPRSGINSEKKLYKFLCDKENWELMRPDNEKLKRALGFSTKSSSAIYKVLERLRKKGLVDEQYRPVVWRA